MTYPLEWNVANTDETRSPRDKYIATILKPSTWGGAIELGILAKHFKTEIASIDVETGRIDQFSPSAGGTGYRLACCIGNVGIG